MGGLGRIRLHDAEKEKIGVTMKKWFKGLTVVLVAAVGIHLGLPAPFAIQLGNEAAEQVGE